MAQQYFLGIDTSTTSSKALLIDEEGKVVAVAASSHTLQTPKPLWSEQDPREWWTGTAASIRKALALCEGNREKAAKMLGIGERTLYRKIKQYGLEV